MISADMLHLFEDDKQVPQFGDESDLITRILARCPSGATPPPVSAFVARDPAESQPV